MKGERNLYIELQKHKLGQIAARNRRISLDKRIFLEVKLTVSEEKRRRADVIPVKPGPASRYSMKVSNTFTVNVIFCPSKANSWRSKNISCNRKESKQCTNTWQNTEVSNSTKRHADNSGNQAELSPISPGKKSYHYNQRYPFILISYAVKISR